MSLISHVSFVLKNQTSQKTEHFNQNIYANHEDYNKLDVSVNVWYCKRYVGHSYRYDAGIMTFFW